jgi:hypothetical protein
MAEWISHDGEETDMPSADELQVMRELKERTAIAHGCAESEA